MARLLIAVSTLAALLSLAPAAPVPRAVPGPLYFPTAVGAEWVVVLKPGPGASEETHTVTAVGDGPGGAKMVSVRVARGGVRAALEYEMSVSQAGLSAVRYNRNRIDPPEVLLRLPVKPGDSWTRATSTGELQRRTCVGVEEVTTPAGTFAAVRIDEVPRDAPAGTTVRSEYYAPGAPPVTVRFDKIFGVMSELKSLTPAAK